MWLSRQTWLNLQSDLETAKAEIERLTADAEKTRVQVESFKAERDAALAGKLAADTEAKKLNATLDTLCHNFQLPRKALYSDTDLAAAGRRQRMRSQLGPEIGFILNEAKRRGMI